MFHPTLTKKCLVLSFECLYFLQADPHCSYKTNIAVSFTTFASRFLLVYNSQVSFNSPDSDAFSVISALPVEIFMIKKSNMLLYHGPEEKTKSNL